MYYVKKIFYAALVAAIFFGVGLLFKSADSVFLQLVIHIITGMLVGFFICPDISLKGKTKGKNTFVYIFLGILSLCQILFSTGWFDFIPVNITSALSNASLLFQIVLGIWFAMDINKEFKTRMKSRFD